MKVTMYLKSISMILALVLGQSVVVFAQNSNEEIGEDLPIAPKENSRSKFMMPGIIITAIGGAALIGGIVSKGLSVKRQAELEDLQHEGCFNDLSCVESANDLEITQARLDLAGSILLISGGIGTVAGIVFIAIGAKSTNRRFTRLRVVPVMTGQIRAATMSFLF